jgi:hypothetical protein
MFSELVLLGILSILVEFKNNCNFKRTKNEKDSFDCSSSDFVFVS